MKRITLISYFIIFSVLTKSQVNHFVNHPNQLNDNKFAQWIGPVEIDGVFLFRKKLSIKNVPEKYIVHVSGDTRYQLFVNGELVSWGPAVNDLANWNYETVDLSPYLNSGENIIASQVWNMEKLNGIRQMSNRTAFILQNDDKNKTKINHYGLKIHSFKRKE